MITTHLSVEKGYSMTLVPERLRGEIAAFDIKDAKGKLIVEKGRRVTATSYSSA